MKQGKTGDENNVVSQEKEHISKGVSPSGHVGNEVGNEEQKASKNEGDNHQKRADLGDCVDYRVVNGVFGKS